VVAKRLRLLHDLVPKAVRIAVLVNPANASVAESNLREVQEAAPAIGLQIQILNASTIGEIDAAFATLARERPDALFVAPDGFFLIPQSPRANCPPGGARQDSGTCRRGLDNDGDGGVWKRFQMQARTFAITPLRPLAWLA